MDGQFFPGQAIQFEGGFVRPPNSLAYVDEATSTTSSVTGPAGIVAGDLLILYDRAINSSGTPTSATPSGFVADADLDEVSADSLGRAIISTKIADGSEASASLSGMSGTNNQLKILYVFRPKLPITTITVVDPFADFQNGDPADQTVSAAGQAHPLVVLGAYAGQTAAARTFSPAQDGSTTVSFSEARWKIYNRAPADVTVGMSDEGVRNTLMSAAFVVS